MTWAPPQLLSRLCQCRYDTSPLGHSHGDLSASRPYRSVHKLTWSRLHRARWPSSGSLVWQPTWGFQCPGSTSVASRHRKPLPPAGLRPALPTPRGGPSRLAERLVEDLGLQLQDSLALIQRWGALREGLLRQVEGAGGWTDPKDKPMGPGALPLLRPKWPGWTGNPGEWPCTGRAGTSSVHRAQA